LQPFAHAFADFAREQFPAIREEARLAHRDTADRTQFAAVRATQHLLEQVETPDIIERDLEAASEYLSALYAAYRFWAAGEPLLTVSRAQIEAALDDAGSDDPVHVPGGACYVQLPEQWFWAQIGPDEPHEPVDGMFIIEGLERREVTVVTVLGLRSDRPGFSQITVTATPRDLTTAHASARTPAFAPVVDGGVAAGLRSLVTPAEVLHLAHLGVAVGSEQRAGSEDRAVP
jgi:hypothetical protein